MELEKEKGAKKLIFFAPFSYKVLIKLVHPRCTDDD